MLPPLLLYYLLQLLQGLAEVHLVRVLQLVAGISELVISITAYINLQTVAESADVILDDKVPVADASMEAMIAIIAGRDVIGEYMLETDISKLDDIEKAYNDFVIDFDMFIYALIYGSESPEFHTAKGGIIHDMWEEGIGDQ